MMTRNKGQKKTVVSELEQPKMTNKPIDEEDCETSIDELIPNPKNFQDDLSASPHLNIPGHESEEDQKPSQPIKQEEPMEEDETTLIMDPSPQKERFTCNDTILKGILEYVSDCGSLPTPTKRSATPKPDKRVTCQSRIASIVDSLWNEVNINAQLDEKDDLLASANLVRPGIFEILKKRREIENKKQTRSLIDRLRPNPKQRKYSDDETQENPAVKAKRFSKRQGRTANRQGEASAKNCPENGIEMSDTQDGATVCSDNSSDTNNDVSKEPSRRSKRRIDMKQHIEWKFCYELKAGMEGKKSKAPRLINRGKENYLSGEEDCPSSQAGGYNRTYMQRSPPPMRAAPSLTTGRKNERSGKRRNGGGYLKKASLSDDESYEAENAAHKEKVRKIWGFKFSRCVDQSSDSELESKPAKTSKRVANKNSQMVSKIGASKMKKDRYIGLSMFEKLILGLKCSVLIGNNEAYIKELDMRDYQTISKRIEKTNFILLSVSICNNNGKENLYNITLTHAKIKPGLAASYPASKSNERVMSQGAIRVKSRGIQRSLFAKSDFKCKSEDEFEPRSSFYRKAEMEQLKERTNSDSAIYDENQKKVRAFTARLVRRTNLDRHKKFLARQLLAKRKANVQQFVYREHSPDTEPELGNTGERFHQSLYDKKRKFQDTFKRPQASNGPSKHARLSPSSSFQEQESYENMIYNSDAQSLAAKVNQPPIPSQLDLMTGLMPNTNGPPFRRHSPKKIIRKVYTGTSTMPKILNRKRSQMASMANMNKQQQQQQQNAISSASASAASQNNKPSETVTTSADMGSNRAVSNNATSEQNWFTSQQPNAGTEASHPVTNGTNGEVDYSDSISEMSSYSQPLVKNLNNKDRNDVSDQNSNANTPKNDLVYESLSPAGPMTPSTDQASDLNPSISMSASQLLRMKKTQPPTSTPMDLTTTTGNSVTSSASSTMATQGQKSNGNTGNLIINTSLPSQQGNSRVILPRPSDGQSYDQKIHHSPYQDEMSYSRMEEDYSQVWNSSNSPVGSSSRTLVGYNQTKVILTNPANNFYVNTVNSSTSSGLISASSSNQNQHYNNVKKGLTPVIRPSKSASNLTLPPDPNLLHQNHHYQGPQTPNNNIPIKPKSISIKADHANAMAQRNLVHKVHSFRKILPKTNSNSDVNASSNSNALPSSANPANQAKVLKSLLESNQPQKVLQPNTASVVKTQQLPAQQAGPGIIGKIGPNGQVINQHNQNSQFNANQSRGTWKFGQKAHVLSATRTKISPGVIKPEASSHVVNPVKQPFELHDQVDLDSSLTGSLPVNTPIKVVRLISENRPVVGQVNRLMGD